MNVVILAAQPPDPWIVGIVGAVIGAVAGGVLTISGELLLRRTAERSHFNGLLGALLLEVNTIHSVARKRADRAVNPNVGVPFDPPLPVEAWRVIISSGRLQNFTVHESSVLTGFYSEVEAANYIASQAPLLFQLSQLSGDTFIAEQFAKDAARVTTEPLKMIVEHSEPIIRLLAGKQIRKPQSSAGAGRVGMVGPGRS